MTRASLEQRARGGEAVAHDVLRLLDALPRFPFAEELERHVVRGGTTVADLLLGERILEIVAALLDPAPHGLGLATAPKALVPFHRRTSGATVCALAEHVAEARATVRDARGTTRMHYTVSPNHQQSFEATVTRLAAELEGSREHLDVSFSTQDPATDTVALADDGSLARDAAGQVVRRPGGHGALLGNLAAYGGDLVVIKNIDNVLPEERRELVVRWRKVLGGLLVELESEIAHRLRRLHEGLADQEEIRQGLSFLTRALGVVLEPSDSAERDRRRLLDRLERPLRVCGVVENRGEPGGGPFWVADAGGQVSLQIVERAQIDEEDPAAAAALADSTHFNPVDIACAVRDWRGKPYDLDRFVDAEAAFVSSKVEGGRSLRVLELPGLWNGAMAGWNTVFVEVPAATFAPVKSVFDLLRREHQP